MKLINILTKNDIQKLIEMTKLLYNEDIVSIDMINKEAFLLKDNKKNEKNIE